MAPGRPEATTTRSAFHQAPDRRGKLQYSEVCDAAACYQSEETAWTVHEPIAGQAYLARPKTTTTRVCDASTPVCDATVADSQVRVVTREFDFEAGSGRVGNLVEETDCGADTLCGDSGADDDRVRRLAYAQNPDAWMVSYVEEESVYFGAVDVANPVSRVRLHYDTSGFSAGAGTTPERCTSGSTASCGGLVRFRETLREGDPVDGTWAVERWTYDAFGQMASYTDPEAYAAGGPATQSVEYDTAAYNTFPLKITNALGHASQFRFDAALGQVTKALAPNGYLQCWAWDAFGRLEWRRERGSPVPGDDLDATGCPAGSYLAHFEFVAIGDPTQQHILQELRPGTGDLVESLRFFDGLGREYQSESESHRSAFEVVTRSWGSRGEAVCETLPYRRPPGQAPQPGFCDTADLLGGPARRVTTHDALLRPLSVTLAAASLPGPRLELEMAYAIDDFGGPDPLLGKLLVARRTVHGTPSRVQRVGSNPRGEVVFLRDVGPDDPTTLLTRDPKGRITQVDGPDVALGLMGTGGSDENLIQIAYNAVDQRTRLSQPPTPTGSGPEWRFEHDLNGELVVQISPRGQRICFERDSLRRLERKNYANEDDPEGECTPGDGDFVLEYYEAGDPDPNAALGLGRLASVVQVGSGGLVEDFAYDLRGRLVARAREFGGSGQFAFGTSFDLLGRPTITVLPDGGSVQNVYRGAVVDRLLSWLPGSLQPDVFLHDLAYHPSGGLERVRFQSLHPSVVSSPVVSESTYSYGPADHRLASATTTLDITGASTPVQQITYSHDTAGNLLTAVDAQGLAQSFTYGPLHRLATAEATGGPHAYGLLGFEYDGAGNLREKGPLLPGGGDAEGRLQLGYERTGGGPVNVATVQRHDGTTGFLPAATYLQDADGAVTEIARLSTTLMLERNADGQIRSIQKTHTEEMGYFYDLSGERIEKRRPILGMTLEGRYTVDASYEVDTVAETHQVHLFVGARRVATSKRPGLGLTTTTAADAVEFYHPDHVGSNTLVTDAQGQRVQDSYLTPFGQLHALADGSGVPVSPSDSTTRHLFTDQELDPETGLHYFGARYQDPWIGRFLSQDPELIGASAGVTFGRIEGDAQNLNGYSYVLNRPTVATDPTGTTTIIGFLGWEMGANGVMFPVGPVGSVYLNGSSSQGTGPTGNESQATGANTSPVSALGGLLGKIVGLLIGENFGAAWWSIGDWTLAQTGGVLPAGAVDAIDTALNSIPADAAENGFHAWHAASNAALATKFGLIGAPLILAIGLLHETPLDPSFLDEQLRQGTVNHALDSITDLAANVFGLAVGYAAPGIDSVSVAATLGNWIPGPTDPDPNFGGTGQLYSGDPSDAWGPYR